jgi:glycosyltransferase involved in cell wall biosynthesis
MIMDEELKVFFRRKFENKKIMLISDTCDEQINGVVTTIKMIKKYLNNLNIDYIFIDTDDFINISLPFYKEVKIAINPRKIYYIIEKEKPSFIHIFTEGPLGYYASKFCKKNKLKYTTSYHTNWPVYSKLFFPFNLLNLEEKIYSYLRKIHNSSEVVLVTNKDMKNLLASKNFSNLKEWSREVDGEIFNINKKNSLLFQNLEKPVMLYVGRLSKEKNIEEFLKLNVNGTKVIVGDGPEKKFLEKKYPNAIFLGKKLNEDLAEIYASADVFVFPSRSETFGVVLIESVACGTPIASVPGIGQNEIIIPNVNGYISDDLLYAIKKALMIDRSKVFESSKKWTKNKFIEIFLNSLAEN